MPDFKVPESIAHADFIAAMKPLHDLLGLTDKEIYADGGIRYTPGGNDCVGSIFLTFAARKVGDESPRPLTTKLEGLEPKPAANAEVAWICSVKVI